MTDTTTNDTELTWQRLRESSYFAAQAFYDFGRSADKLTERRICAHTSAAICAETIHPTPHPLPTVAHGVLGRRTNPYPGMGSADDIDGVSDSCTGFLRL